MGTTFLPILLQKYLSNPATKALSMSNFKITDLQTPTLNSDAATKQYVDNIAGGGGASTGVLPFNLTRGSGVGATTIGQFTNPTGDDLQLTAPTTTGKLIFTDIHGIDFTNTPTTFTNNSGTVIQVSPSGATKGIRISGNNDPNVPLLEIASSGGERHITSSRSGAVNQSQVYIRDTTTGGLTMVELSKENNGPGISMTKTTGTGDGILVTNNGSGYAISTAGTKGDVQITGTLDQNGRIVQNTGGSQDTFSLTHSSGTGDGLHIVKNGTTGHALNIDNNGSGNSINATITTATGGVYIQKNTNSGAGIPLQINHQSNFTSGQSSVVVAHNTNAVGVDITGNGSTGVMLLTQNGAGYGLNVNKASGSGNGINILNGGDGNALDINRTNSTTNGDGINIVVDGSQAGSRAIRARIDSGAATTCEFRQNGSGNAVFIQTASNAGTGLEVVHQGNNSSHGIVIRKEGTSGTGAALDIRNLSLGDGLRVSDETATDNSMFRIDANGNVGIGVSSAGTLNNKVEINDSGVNSGLVINKSANGDGLLINKTAGSAGALAIVNSGSGTDATFYLENRSPGDCMRILDSTSPDTSMFRIDEDGRVGIGVGTGVLTDRFRSEGASGTASALISQGTGTVVISATDTSGTSRMNVNQANARINGRSAIILEPQISTNADDSTPRIRLTTSSAVATEDVIYQIAPVSGQGRHAFGVSGSANTTMNIYSNEGSRRVRMGFLTATQALGDGVCNIRYDPTIHTGTPHLYLESTGAAPSVAIDVNSMGRIANVSDPVNPQDVATRAWVLTQPTTAFTLANSSSGNANNNRIYNLPDPATYSPVLGDALPANPLNYTATSGVGRATFVNYRRSLAYPRLCCLFQNTQQTVYSNASGNNNLDSITHLIYNNSALALTSFYAATGNFINCQVTIHTRTSSGNGRVGTFLLGIQGLYKISLYVNIGTAASPPTAVSAIPLQLVQGTVTNLFLSSVAPTYWFVRSDINNTYNGQNTRCAILNAEFYVNTAGGTYIGFGSASSYGITADNFILTNNVSIFIEYLGVTYS